MKESILKINEGSVCLGSGGKRYSLGKGHAGTSRSDDNIY